MKRNPQRCRRWISTAVGWGRNDLFQYVLNLDEERLAMKGLNRRAVLDAIQLDANPTNTYGTWLN
jgi:hydrophobic/amphiphilic exporter-1 (mainly G- bacteria), HAE1 family